MATLWRFESSPGHQIKKPASLSGAAGFFFPACICISIRIACAFCFDRAIGAPVRRRVRRLPRIPGIASRKIPTMCRPCAADDHLSLLAARLLPVEPAFEPPLEPIATAPPLAPGATVIAAPRHQGAVYQLQWRFRHSFDMAAAWIPCRLPAFFRAFFRAFFPALFRAFFSASFRASFRAVFPAARPTPRPKYPRHG
ncbi:hypothetical protein K7G19_19350 [Cupriavidus sp. DB3]|uniref:hypothetical protein n=1 Tax=Cupriavidus sp. DB3 TaxID=2873259 RepID=UPI001CF35C32|nr:hypothetical protein [Cupriavidus sp. DB3]MCA7085749.1 hypothetical protein [Cupriavidus sp. DB3]